MLKPIITEKGLNEAKKGNYTFYVDLNLNKNQIKNLISRVFKVKVNKVNTIRLRGGKKRAFSGRITLIQARKKAIVTLKGGDKIDLFEESTKKTKKAKK